MPKAFEVKVERVDGRAVVRIAGEFDLAATRAVDEALLEIEGESPEVVVLDLREVTFLDSTGLRTITSADARARETGHELRIVRGPEQIQKLLFVTGMDKILPLVDDPGQSADSR